MLSINRKNGADDSGKRAHNMNDKRFSWLSDNASDTNTTQLIVSSLRVHSMDCTGAAHRQIIMGTCQMNVCALRARKERAAQLLSDISIACIVTKPSFELRTPAISEKIGGVRLEALPALLLSFPWRKKSRQNRVDFGLSVSSFRCPSLRSIHLHSLQTNKR